MRVATDRSQVSADPGKTVDLRVDVVNTGELIDGVTAQLIGLPEAQYAVEPKLLPLFPDAQGQLTVSVGVPSHQPAGVHPVTVAVVSHGAGAPTQHVDVDLTVAARPDVRLSAEPQQIRAKGTARFVLTVENAGNVALDATLKATQDDGRTRARFNPETVHVPPGGSCPVILSVRGPRMVTGSETDRIVGVELVARRADVGPETETTESRSELRRQASVQLRQRPRIGRGVLTACILMGIVGLWAAIFLLGLSQVFSRDPMTKTAPASFFPSSARLEGGGTSDTVTNAASATPAGAMPKTGLLPPGIGGTISGTVTAASDGQPAGRIMVEAYRSSPQGLELVSSAATQSDGTYSVAGLFPTDYLLKFSADGVRSLWYPHSPRRPGAHPVDVAAQGSTEGIDAVVTGLPARISGTIDPGDALRPVRATVVARMVGAADTKPVARATTNGTRYSLSDLPAPATYELSFTAPGYQATKVMTKVGGGEDRLQPAVVLSAGTGRISGMVTDRGEPLGDVTVSTTVAGKDVSVITPTTGQVGAYTLDHLPTPGTYILTFSAPDYGSRVVIIDLGAGQSEAGVDARLRAGVGSVTGIVLDPDGHGLGGATVVVGGSVLDGGGVVDMSELPSTTTLTTGAVGRFSISGLPAHGDYTLTITHPGFAPETVPVSMEDGGRPRTVKARLTQELGGISGSILGPDGSPYVGATVTATNGLQSWTTTSSSPGGALSGGGYVFHSLPPGTYSVTVTGDGIQQRTGLVRVRSGDITDQDFRLGAAD